MKRWIILLFSDSDSASSKRLAGMLCCVFGLVAHTTLIVAEVFFGYPVSRLAYESADSMFWASFAFLGVNALVQGVKGWRK